MSTVVRIFLFFLLMLLATWSLVGIFDDSILIFKFLNFLGQVVPYLSSAIAVALFWLLKATKLKWGVIVIALPSIVIPLLVPHLNLYRGGDEIDLQSGSTKSFSLVTFSKMSHNKNYEEIAKIIDCNKYDVIQVQEMWDIDAFLESVPSVKRNCNIIVNQRNTQLVTFSKLPIAESKYPGFYYVEIQVGVRSIALINVHAIKAIKRSIDNQKAMVKRFTKFAGNEAKPIIVAGDFNATPFNESIMLMRTSFEQARLKNSLMARRSTWPGQARRLGSLGPWIQIDYIFHKGLKSENTFIHSSSYSSDHYPVQTTFTINAKG